MSFNDDELHEHLSAAMMKLHELMFCTQPELEIEAASRLAQIIIQIQDMQNQQVINEIIADELEDDGEEI